MNETILQLQAIIGRKQIAIDAINDELLKSQQRVNDVEHWYKNLMEFMQDVKAGKASIDDLEIAPDGTWKRTDIGAGDIPPSLSERNGISLSD